MLKHAQCVLFCPTGVGAHRLQLQPHELAAHLAHNVRQLAVIQRHRQHLGLGVGFSPTPLSAQTLQ